MNIAQATTSGTRIGRRTGSDLAAGLFQRNNDNDISGVEARDELLDSRVYLSPFSGEGMTFRISSNRWPVAAVILLVSSACTNTPTVVRNNDAEVAVRYDGIVNSLDDAKQTAEKACAARNKTARLRRVSDQGLGLHYGYFECVSTTGLN